MKTARAIIAFCACVHSASVASATSRTLQFDLEPQEGRGNANGNGNGRGNAPDHVPQFVLDKFNTQSQVKPGRPLFYQDVRGNTLNVGGTEISLDEKRLVPVDVMAKNARIIINKMTTLFPPMVFTSDVDDSVIITKNAQGKLLSASKRGNGKGRGVNLDVLQMHEDTFVTVDEDDLDEEKLAQFSFGEIRGRDPTRNLRSSTSLGTLERANNVNQERFLNTALKIVEVDIVADSQFCNAYGGTVDGATARIQSLVTDANTRYVPHGIKLLIKNIRMDCNSGSDPIQGLLTSSSSVCDTNDLLTAFKGYAEGETSLDGDLVHLFYGVDTYPGNYIGCAYRGGPSFETLCPDLNSNSWYHGKRYNTGVNEMLFTTTLISQAKLFNHEVGHNLHAVHASSGLMKSSQCSGCDQFDAVSVSTFLNALANAPDGCIHEEGGPTTSPTAAPTTGNPTTSAPTTSSPTTASPTTASPTTASPTTASPTTASPTTGSPTTGPPTTSPTTAAPTTAAPTVTAGVPSASPTTASPTTGSPTAAPTTASPTTAAPTTASPTTSSPTTASPTTASPTTASPTTASPTPAPTPDPNCVDNPYCSISVNGGGYIPMCPWVANPSFSNTEDLCATYDWMRSCCPVTCSVC